MAGVTWKMAVLLIVLAIFTILEYQIVEAQSAVCNQCAQHAYCYYTYDGYYYCRCRRGYRGDGLLGAGNSGCRRRKLRVWEVVVAIIGAVIGALLLLCLCLACLRQCLSRRRNRGPVVVQQQGEPVYGYPQQTSYPQQGVPMATYETNNHQKVPGPAGVV